LWLVAAAGFLWIKVLLGSLMPVLIRRGFYNIEKLDRPDLAERSRGWRGHRLVDRRRLRLE